MKTMTIGTIGSIVVTIALGLVSAEADAALSEAEIAQLGTTLTPWGAEIAGTPDGSYPAYTGGLRQPPAGFDPASGKWPDPYPEDKPLFSIDASNMAQYEDRLMEAQKELMRRFPSSFRLDVYPTRRSIWLPERVAEHSLANARNPECKTESHGVGLYGCWGGTPFPIPKNGYEAMWNHQTTFTEPMEMIFGAYLVNARGSISLLQVSRALTDFPFYNPEQKPFDGAGAYGMRLLTTGLAPARDVGNQSLIMYPLHFDEDEQRAWSYQPGQRRVRLAPEFSYDTPAALYGGTMFFDEANMFAGRMDRFDFELKGRKLMYMPYNNYRIHMLRGDPAQILGPDHYKPEAVRYELRRVWVVEATPLPGKRHMAKKKRYYLDEDSWLILAYEGWDHSDKLFRLLVSNVFSNYWRGGMALGNSKQIYDLSRRLYAATQTPLCDECRILYGIPQPSDAEFSPARMGALGIR